MKTINQTKYQEAYSGKFVAIRDDEVIASADDYRELAENLREKGMPPEGTTFAYIRPKDRICAY